MDIKNTVFCGDCEEILRENVPDESISLIMTSPPYALARKETYGGIPHDQYVDWFLPKSEQFLRVLKPDGSFVINIKENVVGGERSIYVYELVLALRRQGWKWIDDYVWHKKTAYPGKWRTRFRDAWEHCYHFAKSTSFRMYQDDVMVPAAPATKERATRLRAIDALLRYPPSRSGMSMRTANMAGRTWVYPTNVLYIAPYNHHTNHPAAFPEELPKWFIKLLTDMDGVVLDPFCGSGTTLVAAKKLSRYYVGIDVVAEYCANAEKRLREIL